jgi:hypothetical protein
MVDIGSMSEASRRTLAGMHASDAFLTLSEMGEGPTGMALTLMACRTDPWVERRRATWGGEPGQKRGAGYEYRLTPRGREYRDAVLASMKKD